MRRIKVVQIVNKSSMNRIGDSLIHNGVNEGLIQAFVINNVEFVVIGGLAVAWYCSERLADDLDILVNLTPENSARIFRALGSLNIRGFSPDSFTKSGLQVPLKQFYYAELHTPLKDGVTYSEIATDAVNAKLFNIPIQLASVTSLILLKELAIVNCMSTEKEKHIKDIELLKKLKHT